jgi:hypothetical protein
MALKGSQKSEQLEQSESHDVVCQPSSLDELWELLLLRCDEESLIEVVLRS